MKHRGKGDLGKVSSALQGRESVLKQVADHIKMEMDRKE